MSYKILSFGYSDPGLARQNNEDAWGEVPKSKFYALADGMGGHRAGEVAAQEAVTSMCDQVKKMIKHKGHELTLEEREKAIVQAVVSTNELVFQLSSSSEHLRGMGTTLCCLQFHDHYVIYAHVGDSRIYRFRNQRLELLTADHSLLRELMDLGQINEEQAPAFLYKNIITKAIGTEPFVEPSIETEEIKLGDIYLMCSDGLSDMLTQEEIETILEKSHTISDATQVLIASAKERGGYDNITVVMTQVKENK